MAVSLFVGRGMWGVKKAFQGVRQYLFFGGKDGPFPLNCHGPRMRATQVTSALSIQRMTHAEPRRTRRFSTPRLRDSATPRETHRRAEPNWVARIRGP